MGQREATSSANNAIRAEHYASGTAMVASTKVDGVQHLKLTMHNPMASADDIVGILDTVRAFGERLAHDGRLAPATTAAEAAR